MKNELTVKGTTNFMGVELPNIYGGFGKDQKCILAKTIAEIHGVLLYKINELINNNLDEFELGVDILDLKTYPLQGYVLENGLLTNAQWGNAKNIYLLSEQGYFALVMLMKTEKSKEIRRQLRKEYFNMRKVIQSDKQLKAQLLLQVYNGGMESIEASKQLISIEKKTLINKIEEQKPKVDYCEKVLNAENQKVYTITEIAKKYDMTGKELNQILYNEGIQFKNNGTWLLYSQHTGKGYVQHFTKVKVENGNERTIYEHMKWTQKGRMMIHELLKECRYI